MEKDQARITSRTKSRFTLSSCEIFTLSRFILFLLSVSRSISYDFLDYIAILFYQTTSRAIENLLKIEDQHYRESRHKDIFIYFILKINLQF